MGGNAAQVMVGRDRELARVTGLLEDALAGRGRLVLCTGEAGIGKTRLAEELAVAASARGVPVAWARAADRGSSPPYGLWRLVLAESAVGSGSAADLWPAVFGAADLGAESSVAQRFALFAEVRGRLAQAASRGGLVLVLDDLQWADEASAVLLVEVVRQLRGTRILVFATYRDAPDGVLPRLSAEANTERMDLHGLPAEAVGDLLLAAGLESSPDRARRVHAETGGNPFLVRELARTLAGPPGSSVPGRVLEATAYRLRPGCRTKPRDRAAGRTALVMEATGVPEWDGEICRVCEQALSISGAGDELPDDLRARVSARYAQALVYRGQYDRAGPVSRDALAAAESAADPVALVDALRARQLACCAPEGLAERIVLAGRMLEAADVLGSAWAEMWGRMWRIDTLFETGQLRLIQRELTDLSSCLDRLSGPVGRCQYLELAATLALATGRFAEAERLAREGFKLFSDMGHPAAFGALAVILSQSGAHIGMDRACLVEAVRPHPRAPAPGGRGHHPGGGHHLPGAHPHPDPLAPGRPGRRRGGPRAGRADPVLDAYAGDAHGSLGSRARGRHRPGSHAGHRVPGVAVRAVPGSARRERRRAGSLHGPRRAADSGWRPRRWAAWMRRFATWRPRCRSATLTAPAGTPYRRASNWPPPWPAGRIPLRATLRWRRQCWTPRRARPSSSAWFRSPSGSTAAFSATGHVGGPLPAEPPRARGGPAGRARA